MELQKKTKAPIVLEAILHVTSVNKSQAKKVWVCFLSEHCFVPFFPLKLQFDNSDDPATELNVEAPDLHPCSIPLATVIASRLRHEPGMKLTLQE